MTTNQEKPKRKPRLDKLLAAATLYNENNTDNEMLNELALKQPKRLDIRGPYNEGNGKRHLTVEDRVTNETYRVNVPLEIAEAEQFLPAILEEERFQTQQEISRTKIAYGLAKRLCSDTLRIVDKGIRLASMPIIGHLPFGLKRKIYGSEWQAEEATKQALITSIIASTVPATYTFYKLSQDMNLEEPLITAQMIGTALGVANVLPNLSELSRGIFDDDEITPQRGSILGYIASPPFYAIHSACKLAKGIKNHVKQRYSETKSELESQLEE